jgi:hypothetical protein
MRPRAANWPQSGLPVGRLLQGVLDRFGGVAEDLE